MSTDQKDTKSAWQLTDGTVVIVGDEATKKALEQGNITWEGSNKPASKVVLLKHAFYRWLEKI